MTLIVEDGTGVENANNYVDLDTIRAYAADRGIDLPAADEDLEPHAHLAMDWFEMQDFTGTKNDDEQPLAFPRDDADTIPALVIKVMCEAATTAVTISLQPQYAGTADGSLKKKKLDVIEKEFFESSWSTKQPLLTKLNTMIQPLLGGGLGSGRLQTLRV